jgi:hypothetical protein
MSIEYGAMAIALSKAYDQRTEHVAQNDTAESHVLECGR